MVFEEDQKPELEELTGFEEKNFFIFIVDRSGSMSGEKMNTTKEAMLLFMQSLPPDCQFQIIGFGSTYEGLDRKDKGFQYNDNNLEFAKE